jgi:hypothetical protein
MKAKILIALLVLSMACPQVSHGFGLLRYIFDGISNQLGLDRGPIPKVVPPGPQADHGQNPPPVRNPGDHKIHIQAEGF